MAKAQKTKYRNMTVFSLFFPHFWRLKPCRITSFSNFWILFSLFGEISTLPAALACLPPSSPFANSRRRKRADEFFAEFRASPGLLNSLKKFGNHPNSRNKVHYRTTTLQMLAKPNFEEESKNRRIQKRRRRRRRS
jgi:hypothetical protein